MMDEEKQPGTQPCDRPAAAAAAVDRVEYDVRLSLAVLVSVCIIIMQYVVIWHVACAIRSTVEIYRTVRPELLVQPTARGWHVESISVAGTAGPTSLR